MPKFFKSRFFRLTLCVFLACACLALIGAFTHRLSAVQTIAAEGAGPLQDGVTQAKNFISDFFSAYTRYTRLQAEFDALSAENARLSALLRKTDALRQENEMLSALAGIRARDARIDYFPARIIAAASDALGVRYTLSCGTADGVEDGMLAVTAQGAAGFLSACTEHSCVLLPLVLSDEGLSAFCARTGASGIVQGSYLLREKGLVRLSFVDKGAELAVGDIVETSGAGGVYPPGLALGMVTETGLEENALSRYALLKPFASLDGAREVFVVVGFSEE